MPELPEVESIRRTLAPILIGARIERVIVRRRDVVEGKSGPAAMLSGCTVRALERRGKQLAVVGSDGGSGGSGTRAVVVQLGMSGQLIAHARGEDALSTNHVHVLWMIEGGGSIAFRDPRRFGGVRPFASVDALMSHWNGLGPDAHETDATALGAHLFETCTRSRRAIKSALLDQGVIAGVGNIYADEALFRAGVRPTRSCHRVTRSGFDAIGRAISDVMRQAVDAGGSTVRDYVNGAGEPGRAQLLHAVYGRTGQECLVCAGPLKSGVVSQRTTVWCPACQA